jgi:hypothetical protein
MSTRNESKQIAALRTSSLKQRSVVLLVSLIVLCVGIEATTRNIHNHRRPTLEIERGLNGAFSLRPLPGTTQVLLAGNSLIHEGVNAEAMQARLGSGYRVQAAGIPGSTYFDWKYGLKSLFSQGSHPDVVLFALSPVQILNPPVITSIPDARLLRPREALDYYLHEKSNLTDLSNLLLAQQSTFFYLRDIFRIYFRKLVPGFETLANECLTRGSSAVSRSRSDLDASRAIYLQRLLALRAVCNQHGIKFVFLVVPTRQKNDAEAEPFLLNAMAQLGIPVVEPVNQFAWPLSSYKPDKYHLTPRAAVSFSQLVADDLLKVVNQNRAESRYGD